MAGERVDPHVDRGADPLARTRFEHLGGQELASEFHRFAGPGTDSYGHNPASPRARHILRAPRGSRARPVCGRDVQCFQFERHRAQLARGPNSTNGIGRFDPRRAPQADSDWWHLDSRGDCAPTPSIFPGAPALSLVLVPVASTTCDTPSACPEHNCRSVLHAFGVVSAACRFEWTEQQRRKPAGRSRSTAKDRARAARPT